MQSLCNFNNNLFSPDNFKYVEINGPKNNMDTDNFINGIQNARKLLNNLEKSFRKSRDYEEKLMRCKSNHYHIHDIDELWDTDVSVDHYKLTAEKSSRDHLVLSESLSTMGIIYLQFQYEELTKQYEILLQAYNDRCKTVKLRDTALTKMKDSLKLTHERIIEAHEALLSVADKYLTLRRKKTEQMKKFTQMHLGNLQFKANKAVYCKQI